MNTNIKVTLYLDTLSPFSKVIQDDLHTAGIIPEVKLVNEDMDAVVEMYKLTKMNRSPVIKIVSGDQQEVLVGYSEENKKKMESLLRIKLPKNTVSYDW
jgi:hypothetical protein